MRRNDAHEAVVCRRIPCRGARLFADAAHHQIGSDRRPGTAARTSGAAARVIGIARRTAIGAAVAGGIFTHISLGEDDGARLAQTRDNFGILRRAVIGIGRDGAACRAHVERVELILDDEDNAVQGPLELAGARELLVECLGRFQRVGHVGIVVGGIGLRAFPAQVQRHQRAELAGLFLGLDIAQHETCLGIDDAVHAGAVIGLDALQIVGHELCGGELSAQDRAMNIGNRGLFQPEIAILRAHGRPPGNHKDEHAEQREGANRRLQNPMPSCHFWYPPSIQIPVPKCLFRASGTQYSKFRCGKPVKSSFAGQGGTYETGTSIERVLAGTRGGARLSGAGFRAKPSGIRASRPRERRDVSPRFRSGAACRLPCGAPHRQQSEQYRLHGIVQTRLHGDLLQHALHQQ
jgi:hypothetical protein